MASKVQREDHSRHHHNRTSGAADDQFLGPSGYLHLGSRHCDVVVRRQGSPDNRKVDEEVPTKGREKRKNNVSFVVSTSKLLPQAYYSIYRYR